MDEVTMTVFSITELNRLVQLIPETDPRTPQYATLLESIERFGAAIKDVDNILYYAAALNGDRTNETRFVPSPKTEVPDNVVAFPAVVNEVAENTDAITPEVNADAPQENAVTPVVEEEKKEEAPAKTYTKAEVRAALVELRSSDSGVVVSDFIQETVGCPSFGAVPEEKYAALMSAIEKKLGKN